METLAWFGLATKSLSDKARQLSDMGPIFSFKYQAFIFTTRVKLFKSQKSVLVF